MVKEIWAPWRMEYILANNKEHDGCFLCEKAAQSNDEENYVLYRSQHNFVILNAYPYNAGHLMVVPYRHGGNMDELTADEMSDHLLIVSKSLTALKKAFEAQGFNIGMNIGKVAGAGVTDHLHTHIVPRWEGDTNFMPVIADIKVVPEGLKATYDKLKNHF
jgi:ATP adenylyltransferase